MNVTIKDVAKKAGVSIATVSRVLNKKDRVKEETRRKVEEAIEKLQYRPDPIARTMTGKESKSIGLLVPTLSNEYWAVLSESIQDELWKRGYSMMLCATGDGDIEKGNAYLKAFVDRKMDGIIVGCLCDKPLHELETSIMEVYKNGISVIAFDSSLPGISSVSGDHIKGAMDAVQHLINLGHREIAYIDGSESFQSVFGQRELGYRYALNRAGISVDEKLIRRVKYGVQNGYEAAKDLIQSGAKFTALFCWNDLLAFGAIKGLREMGLRVPEDIAVVGYDDINAASLFSPPLTTVRQPINEISVSLVELMMETLENKDSNYAPRDIKHYMKLVVRASCGYALSALRT